VISAGDSVVLYKLEQGGIEVNNKAKCDCCGRMTPISDMQLLVIESQEFDGIACKDCEYDLKLRDHYGN
jgi:hypothetical protein